MILKWSGVVLGVALLNLGQFERALSRGDVEIRIKVFIGQILVHTYHFGIWAKCISLPGLRCNKIVTELDLITHFLRGIVKVLLKVNEDVFGLLAFYSRFIG